MRPGFEDTCAAPQTLPDFVAIPGVNTDKFTRSFGRGPLSAYLRGVTTNASPEHLYHYTSLAGLMGIVGGDQPSLRASDARFLNDTEEVGFGLATLNQLMGDLVSSITPDVYSTLSGPARAEFDALERDTKMITSDDYPPIYVASFSDSPDLLSQWRAYGRVGYAIEFDRVRLTEQIESAEFGTLCTIQQVKYGDDARASIKTHLADPLRAVIMSGGDTKPYKDQAGFDKLSPHIAFSKDEAFREEREWRLAIQLPTLEVSHREHDNGPVPYVQVPITAAAITEIVVGPTPRKSLRAQAVRQWLSNIRLGISVRESPLPYRG